MVEGDESGKEHRQDYQYEETMMTYQLMASQ